MSHSQSTMIVNFIRIGCLLFVCGGMLFLGCAPTEELGKVTGKVTFEGKPVSPALITFSNRDKGVNILAEINADGTYQVMMAKGAGLPLGTYKVIVNPPLVDAPLGPLQAPLPKNQKFENIPERYRRLETSPLSLRVNSGENPLNVELTP